MIGAIADDFTGGTDVAVALRRAGLRTVILFGSVKEGTVLPPHDAVVIALKTRTVEPADAVQQSIAATQWLREHGAEVIYFKYCSTFDSTPRGNIGPVADALADLLSAARAVVVPSSPEHLRSQYMGHLFVDQQLLSDSPMRHHPLTPMTDSFIPRVLGTQTPRLIELIDHRTVRAGREALRAELDIKTATGARYVVIDAVDDRDLAEIGAACIDDVLITGAAGLAGGLGAAYAARSGSAQTRAEADLDPVGEVPAAVLAGSCSARTLEQIHQMKNEHASFHLDAVTTPDSASLAAAALAWFDSLENESAPLIYSSLPPEELRRAQEALGRDRASALNEAAMGIIARGLVERGIRRFVIAGGETSGSVVTALEVDGGLIGHEIAPGVPWIYTSNPDPVALLLKSGNFGDPQMLNDAVSRTRAQESGPDR